MKDLRAALLVVHLLSLAGWLGLSTGAWLLLRRIRGRLPEEALWPAFARVVDLEHLCLLALLASGVGLAFVAGWKTMTAMLWFVLKLAAVMIVVVPIECADVVLTARVKADPSPERIARYERFLWWAGGALVATAVGIVALGKFRPGA